MGCLSRSFDDVGRVAIAGRNRGAGASDGDRSGSSYGPRPAELGVVKLSKSYCWRHDCGWVGSEFAGWTPDFLGAKEAPGFRLSSFPPEAMDDARGWGAFPVLAYPDDPDFGWRYWDNSLRPGGIEVLNLFTSLRGTSWGGRLRLGMYYPFSHYYFLKSIAIPAESLSHWDDFLQRGKIWGFEASDAHGGFRVGSWLAMKVPSYADTFSFVGMGISRRYEADPEAAVRRGDFFNCIRGAGEPDRFEFSAHHGLQDFPSGGDAPVNSSSACCRADDELGGARRFEEGWGGGARDRGGSFGFGRRCGWSLSRGGVLVGHPLLRPDVPWILSNPIFVGTGREAMPTRRFTTIRAQLAPRAEWYKR